MSAQLKIKTRCPVCKTAYALPSNSVGHRARCPKCDSVFRVVVPGVQKPAAAPHPSPDAAEHQAPPMKPPPEVAVRRQRERGPGGLSDDDIVAWLMEDSERDDVPEQPRRWQEPSAPPAEPPQKASA